MMARKKEQQSRDRSSDSFYSTAIPPQIQEPVSSISARQRDYDPLKDDLINFLSAARENRRARQVFEWETARRNSIVETV